MVVENRVPYVHTEFGEGVTVLCSFLFMLNFGNQFPLLLLLLLLVFSSYLRSTPNGIKFMYLYVKTNN
jgi:hypothetical protein